MVRITRYLVNTGDELLYVRAKFAEQAQMTVIVMVTLRNALDSVDWGELTESAFFRRFEQAQQLMKEYVELLNSMNYELAEIAMRFESAD